MIRPELLVIMRRWRELLAGLGIALLGFLIFQGSFGAGRLFGGTLMLGGLIAAVAGIQRGRFRQVDDGPGVVMIDERRVTYMGPETGGLADLDLMTRLELLPEGPSWRLVSEDGARLDIPVRARGADRLFDLFAALPGVGLDRLISLSHDPGGATHLIWQAKGRGAEVKRLH